MNNLWNESFIEQQVTYVAVIDDTVLVIERVPARVNVETGEQLFSPDTVERIQHIIKTRKAPVRVIEAPVFDFAA